MVHAGIDFGYPKDVCFRCMRCAVCCGDTENRKRHILLLMKEARTVSEAVLKPVKGFAFVTRGREPYVYEMKKTRGEGKCVFLEGTDCSIYAVRPLVCRFYPFELSTLKNGKPHFFCTGECPGIGKGDRLEREHFQSLLKQAYGLLKR